jgi:hypothetical protein
MWFKILLALAVLGASVAIYEGDLNQDQDDGFDLDELNEGSARSWSVGGQHDHGVKKSNKRSKTSLLSKMSVSF